MRWFTRLVRPGIVRPATKQSRRQDRFRSRPQVERLEDRLAPAVIAWDGGPTGLGTNFNDPVNWVGDAAPGAFDDAQIGAAFSGINITSNGFPTIRSLASEAPLTI